MTTAYCSTCGRKRPYDQLVTIKAHNNSGRANQCVECNYKEIEDLARWHALRDKRP